MKPLLDFPTARTGLTRWLLAALMLAAAALTLSHPGHAAGDDMKVQAVLVAEPAALSPGQPFWISLRQTIAPGWHTYWVNPGDSGQGTVLDWDLPPGFTVEPIAWPVPERIPFGPLMSFGYKGEVDLLVRVHPPADLPPGETVTLRAEAEWLVCADVCIPEWDDLEIALPVAAGARQPPPSSDSAARFHAARAALPVASPWPVAAARVDDRLLLTVEAPSLAATLTPGAESSDLLFFPDLDGVIENAAPQALAVEGDRLILSIPAARNLEAGPGSHLSGLLVARLPDSSMPDSSMPGGNTPDVGTLGGGDRDVQGFTFTAAPVSAVGGSAAAGSGAGHGGAGDGMALLAGIGLLEALLLALLGGAILNLMPCVFPVIAMKAMGLVQKTGAPAAAIRRHGLAYALGVLVSFGAIGVALLAIKAGGAAIGWGFQLQSPVFVALMAYLMLAVGLNLSGVFTIGERLMGVGQTAAAKPGTGGAFLTGVLASAVAAPCTAPFMATAIGFALVQSPPVAMAVLLAVGLGMALPYLLLTWIPGALRFLPRPGAWMEHLRRFLAFPMYGAAAWLVWVLSQQAGSAGVMIVLGGGVLMALGFWLWQTAKSAGQAGGRRFWRAAGHAAAAAVLVLAVTMTFSLRAPGPGTIAADGESVDRIGSGPAWEAFSETRLAELQAAGQPVFVNFTAAWCITCDVNERLALSSATMRDLFERGDIAYLKGDWTNRNPEVTRMLERFGRSGVPLYLLYAPDGTTEVLPQILTEEIVAGALRRLPGSTAGTAAPARADAAGMTPQPPATPPS